MEIIAINGSPRKNWNTVAMCEKFLEGAASVAEGVNTTLVNLYDLNYKGCISCFGCKRKGSKNYGKCIVRDDLHDVLQKVSAADAVAFASPIYFGDITGQMRCFLERLLFPFNTYEAGYRTIAPKRMPVVMIYTMNVSEEGFTEYGYDQRLQNTESVIGRILTPVQRLCAFNTYQFKNYDDYEAATFSEQAKAEHRRTQFPLDLQAAFDMGKEFIGNL